MALNGKIGCVCARECAALLLGWIVFCPWRDAAALAPLGSTYFASPSSGKRIAVLGPTRTVSPSSPTPFNTSVGECVSSNIQR